MKLGLGGLALTIVAISLAIALRHFDPDGAVVFALTNHHGEPVTQNDFRGRTLLVFFGFTHCDGICPTYMSDLTRVMASLDDTGDSRGVTPIFVSVDPERDSPSVVAAFLAHFDARFVGLTGSRAALEQTAKTFKTFLQEAPPRGANDYQVSHASTVYLVDTYGRIVDYLSLSQGVEAVAERVRSVV